MSEKVLFYSKIIEKTLNKYNLVRFLLNNWISCLCCDLKYNLNTLNFYCYKILALKSITYTTHIVFLAEQNIAIISPVCRPT